MKVNLSYLPHEEATARAVERCVKLIYPAVRVHKTERYPPRKQTHLTLKIPLQPSDSTEKDACNTP